MTDMEAPLKIPWHYLKNTTEGINLDHNENTNTATPNNVKPSNTKRKTSHKKNSNKNKSKRNTESVRQSDGNKQTNETIIPSKGLDEAPLLLHPFSNDRPNIRHTKSKLKKSKLKSQNKEMQIVNQNQSQTLSNNAKIPLPQITDNNIQQQENQIVQTSKKINKTRYISKTPRTIKHYNHILSIPNKFENDPINIKTEEDVNANTKDVPEPKKNLQSSHKKSRKKDNRIKAQTPSKSKTIEEVLNIPKLSPRSSLPVNYDNLEFQINVIDEPDDGALEKAFLDEYNINHLVKQVARAK